jgi:hypothetical protein
MKDRVELHLDRDLNAWLSRVAERPGTSKSMIVGDALRAFLERGAATEIEKRVNQRLRQLTALMTRMDRNLDILMETQALFIHHQFSVIPPVPASDLAAARAQAHDRFLNFIEQVAGRLHEGKSLIRDALERTAAESIPAATDKEAAD